MAGSPLWLALVIGFVSSTVAWAVPFKVVTISPEERALLITRAKVWLPSQIGSKDVLRGEGAFDLDEEARCTYVEKSLSGTSAKFLCRQDDGRILKVKYGTNPEIYSEMMASRLYWLLGFAADSMYRVRIICRGCSSDPWRKPKPTSDTYLFRSAVVEDSFAVLLDDGVHEGVALDQLSRIEPSRGGSTKAEVDAFKLLTAFVHNWDTGARNNSLVCVDPASDGSVAGCQLPMIMQDDLGGTFGTIRRIFHRLGKANFREWRTLRVWKNSKTCEAYVRSLNLRNPFRNPKISEEGRKFLAELLIQVSPRQIEDLFTVARVERKGEVYRGKKVVVADWVKIFEHKVDEVVDHPGCRR